MIKPMARAILYKSGEWFRATAMNEYAGHISTVDFNEAFVFMMGPPIAAMKVAEDASTIRL